MPTPKPRRSSSTESVSASVSITRADVVDRAAGSRGSTSRSSALVGARPTRRPGPGSTRGTAWPPRPPRPRRRPRRRRRRSAPAPSIGPIVLRREHAEPAALDHRRAAHPDVRVRGGDHHVAAAEQRGVAGEAAARRDADERHQPAQRGEVWKARQSRPETPVRVGVAGPPAAALGEEHDRQAEPLGQLEHAVLLAVVLHALRAGEHRVVVGHHDALRGWPVEAIAVDAADAGDQAVGRRALDQLVERARAGAGRRWRARRTRRTSPRRTGRRRSRGPCGGRCAWWRATAGRRAASRPISWRSSTSARSAAAAPSGPRSRPRRSDDRCGCSVAPSSASAAASRSRPAVDVRARCRRRRPRPLSRARRPARRRRAPSSSTR